ncbi:hypothetical protein AB0M54_29760 [Actinoplanes sp. NPDC051470]|uniref:hypothetical protein n=1 Tax=Actinoplanes sp. NPDC051470 TaxID=3157224 RepID=UPI0034240AF0
MRQDVGQPILCRPWAGAWVGGTMPNIWHTAVSMVSWNSDQSAWSGSVGSRREHLGGGVLGDDRDKVSSRGWRRASAVIEMLLIRDHSRMKFDATTPYGSTHEQQFRLLPIAHPEDFVVAADQDDSHGDGISNGGEVRSSS